MHSFSIQLLSLMFLSSAANAAEYGSFLGSAYEMPHLLASNALLNTTDTLESGLRSILVDNETAASIRVQSIYNEHPLFEFNYVSNTTTARNISSDSVFRIGSVSKVFTVYALLLQGGFASTEELVIDLVPELRECRSEDPRWEEMTLGTLAGQMAGILRDYNQADLSQLPMDWAALGFPSLDGDRIIECSRNETDQPCSRHEFFKGVLAQPAVFDIYQTPAYSNSAFRILAYAVAAMAQRPFNDAFANLIAAPLNLTHTFMSTPADDALGVIVDGDGSFYQDLGDESPTGGMYSSVNDLTTLATSILRSSLLSTATTRRWLKPAAHTSRLDLSVGLPWEIYRYVLTSDGSRVIDLYCKSGSIGVYASQLILVPEYGISVVILIASSVSPSPINSLTNEVIEAILPAMETTAKSQSSHHLAGTYSNNTINSTLILTTDDLPGLVVESWIRNGSDILAVADSYSESTGSGNLASVRLFQSRQPSSNSLVFRAVFDTYRVGQDEGLFKGVGETWSSVDQLVYGKKALDMFIFEVQESGMAVSVQNDALEGVLIRR